MSTKLANLITRFSPFLPLLFALFAASSTVTPRAHAQGIPLAEDEADSEESEHEGDAIYQRAKWAFEQRALPGTEIPQQALIRGLEQTNQAEAVQALRSSLATVTSRALSGGALTDTTSVAGVIAQWVNIGPAPISGSQTLPNNTYDPSLKVSGRVSAIAVDPSNANHWVIGTGQGGVWVTQDAGVTWSSKTDGMPSMAIGAVAFAPGDSNIVYAGTGESVTSDAYGGAGLLKSIDGGNTWASVNDANLLLVGVSFSEIRVSPTDSNTLVATTVQGHYGPGYGGAPSIAWRGVLKSTDGGVHWTNKYPGTSSGEASDIEVDASNFNNQFAALSDNFGYSGNGVYRSTDAGNTWALIDGPWSNATNFPGGVGRIEMAISPADPNVLWVSVQDRTDPSTTPKTAVNQNDGKMLGLWRTTNALAATPTWTQITTPAGTSNLWYAHQLLVDPADSRILYFGDTRLIKCNYTSGTAVWTDETRALHADQHAIVFSGNRLIVGNDGGVYYRDDRGTTATPWVNCNSQLALTQFYLGAVGPADKNFAIGGAQDNGCEKFTGYYSWDWLYFGDGAATAVSNSRPTTDWAVSSQNLTIARTTTGGTGPANFTVATNGIDDLTVTPINAPFIAHFEKHPTKDNVFIAGTDNIWRCNNFFDTTTAPTWTKNGPDEPNFISALAFADSDANANTYAYATTAGTIKLTQNGGTTWKNLNASGGVPNRYVTDLSFDPGDASTLYVTLSGFDENTPGQPGHVFRTKNALAAAPTWQDISPPVNLPANTVAIDPTHPEVVYTGTDLGVWQGDTAADGTLTWTHMGPSVGMPNVAVYDLHVQYLTRRLFAFTHGRGAFVADLFPANDHVQNARLISGASGRVTDTNINASLENGEPDTYVPTPEKGTHSVWFLWQAPIAGMVEFNTIGSNFDTDLAVYEIGSSWNGLALPAKASDNNSGGSGTSKVTFQATAGTAYFICVNGSGPNDAGFYAMNWVVEDHAPPTIVVTEPPHNAARTVLTAIAGTASDPSGIQDNTVHFTLFHAGTSQYWNGSAWTNTQTALNASVTGNNTWSYDSVPTGNNLRTGQYFVSASAVDRAGNPSQAQTGVNQTTFFVDNSPPDGGVSTPPNGSSITSNSYTFSGQANDSVAIDRVVLFIRRNSDNFFWNGSTWVSDSLNANLAATYNSSTHNWTSNFPLPTPGSTLLNGSYNFIALIFDTAGNYVQRDSAVTVDFHQVYTWTHGSLADPNPANRSDYWGTPANWSPNGVPDATDVAVIDLGDAIRSTISRTVYELRMSNGSINFDNAGDTLVIQKRGTWTGGTWNGPVKIQPGAQFQISGAAVKWLGGGVVVTNLGDVTWSGPGQIGGYNNSLWTNKSGSSFTAATDGDVFGNYYGGNSFTNESGAVFAKSGGTSSDTYIDEWTFNNSGRIDAALGTIHFNTTLNVNSGTTFGGIGRILLNGTTNLFTLISSTGNQELIGTLNANTASASFAGTNPMVWSSGAINGTFTVSSGSMLILNSAATKQLGGGAVLTNLGQVKWTNGGLLQGYNNSIINNESGAVFEAVTDGDIFANYYGGNVFNNKTGATFIKTGKSSDPNGYSLVDEWQFNNAGTIRSDDGVLSFNTALYLNAGSAIARQGSKPARVSSTNYFELTGTTTVSNITFEAAGNWAGNNAQGTAGNGVIATTAGGTFDWSAGNVDNIATIAANSTFTITSAATKQIGGGAVLKNFGNCTWTGTGNFQGYNSSTFLNGAGSTFIAATDAPMTNFYGGNAFTNAAGASFAKTGGTGTNTCDWAFNNNGIIACSSGTFAMNSGGASSGTFAPSGSGLLLFTGGQQNVATTATFQGTGTTRVAGGTLDAVNHVSVDSTGGLFEIAGGTVTSEQNGSFDIHGNLSWSGGTIAGTFNVIAGSTFTIPGGGQIGGGGLINNFGTATWTGVAPIQGYNNSTWRNKSGGAFIAAADGDIFSNYYGGNVFINENGATFRKTIGTQANNSLVDEWSFQNAGKIECQQGTLRFNTTLDLNAGSSFAGAGRLLLENTTNWNAVVTSTGNPELSGTLNGSPGAGYSGSLPFTWSAGAIGGQFTLASGSVLNLATANSKQIGGSSVFTNLGRVNWKAGQLQGYNNSVFNNESGAIFSAEVDGDLFANYYGGNVFNNKTGALFVKSGRSNPAGVDTLIDEWQFNNAGTVRSDDGVLRFHTELHLQNGGVITHVGSLAGRVRSTNWLDLTGTTTVNNVVFETAGDWVGNTAQGTAGNGTVATANNGVFEWTGGTAGNVVNIAPNSLLSIAGPSTKQIGGSGVLNNNGIATWSGAGALQGYNNSTFANRAPGTFIAAGTGQMVDFYGGNLFLNEGTFAMGPAPGVAQMSWSFTQTATGRLNLKLAGIDGNIPQFDRLSVSGNANLAGSIGLYLVGQYIPLPNSTFTVMTFGGRNGAFTPIQSLGDFVNYNYTANSLTLVAKDEPKQANDWKQYFFGDPNAPDANMLANPSGDGVPNLLKYALGLNPHNGSGGLLGVGAAQAGSSSFELAEAGERYLAIAFIRPAGAAALTDVTYSAERATSLRARDWSPADVVQQSVSPGPGPDRETVIMRSTHPISGITKEYLRLSVSSIP